MESSTEGEAEVPPLEVEYTFILYQEEFYPSNVQRMTGTAKNIYPLLQYQSLKVTTNIGGLFLYCHITNQPSTLT